MPKLSPRLDPDSYAARPVPSFQEFQQLWASWDTVILQMIPADQLLSVPIKLRNCFLFYMGHIPTFLDIHVARAIQGPPTKPSSFRDIFERGIDPDVEDPNICHAHSNVPEAWPPVKEIIAFQDRVRARVKLLYEDGTTEANCKLGRALWLAFEHDGIFSNLCFADQLTDIAGSYAFRDTTVHARTK